MGSVTTYKKIHFIGIGGIGVSSLARYFLAQNCVISGSNDVANDTTDELRAEGVSIYIGHADKNIPKDADLVVRSQAIPPSNPELIFAKRHNIECKTYPEVVGELTSIYTTIAIAGAHGKSTTTAMVSAILIHAGFDPTIIIGTKLPLLKNSNFRLGKSKYLILEADEFGEAFLNYHPDIAVITNIDREHLDCFPTLAHVKKCFATFINRLSPDGTLIVNAENKNLMSMRKQFPKNTLFYGQSITPSRATRIGHFLPLPGAHNLSNALAAFEVSHALGISAKDADEALRRYRGAWRRMEYKGVASIVADGKTYRCNVYDDYAHHPSEIAATLNGFNERYPGTPIVCVFQPHQIKRLIALFPEFKTAFAGSTSLILLDTYRVAGRETGANESGNLVEKLARGIAAQKEHPCHISYIRNSPKLLYMLKHEISKSIGACHANTKPHATIVMMGAGDINTLTPRLLQD